MGKRGDSTIDLMLNVLIIVIIGLVVLWYMNNRVDARSMNAVVENLDIIEGSINLACMYDNMNITDIQLTMMKANLTILDNEICIKQEGLPLLCRDAICKSVSHEAYDLAKKNRFMLMRNKSGVKLKDEGPG